MRRLLAVVLVMAACSTHAQEPLADILERGHVVQWLACGPFPSPHPQPLVDLAKLAEPTAGGRDFFSSAGGIAALRPRAMQTVRVEGQPEVTWFPAAATGPAIDLAPLFPTAEEGVAYAGFYADAVEATDALIEVHSPLGASVWLNGQPVIVPGETSLPLAGVDSAVVQFRAGSNFLVAQAPGARLDALARALDMTPREVSGKVFANRTLLTGASGFELGVRMLPVRAAAGIHVASRMVDGAVVLYNPGPMRSGEVSVMVKSPALDVPALQEVAGVAAGARTQVPVKLPEGAAGLGETVPVEVTVLHGDATVTISGSMAPQSSERAEVLVLTGTRYVPRENETPEQRLARQSESLHRQLQLAKAQQGYGFEAGPQAEWEAWLSMHPEDAQLWREMVARGQGGAMAQYARIDERIAPPEVLARNIAMGAHAAHEHFDAHGIYDAWRAGGVAPQTAQLVAQAGIGGMLSSVDVAGMPALGRQAGLGGEAVLHRHSAKAEGPTSLDVLRGNANRRRTELAAMGISSPLILLENALDPPEPFLREAQWDSPSPTLRFSGDAAERFFETARAMPLDLPAVTLNMQCAHPGELVANAGLQEAYRAVAELAPTVEALCTFAALEGFTYPHAAMDYAWRALAWHSQPHYMAAAPGSDAEEAALLVLREAWELLQQARDDAMAHVAGRIAMTPPVLPDGAEALEPVLVFCPGEGGVRVCEVDLPVPQGRTVQVLNGDGGTLPTRMGAAVSQRKASRSPGTIRRVAFAAALPTWGFEVVYPVLLSVAEEAPGDSLLIENRQWRVQVDEASGDIVQLQDKRSGNEYAAAPMASAWALGLDAAKLPRELWTTGQREQAGGPVKVETRKLRGVQEMTITAALGGGTIERTIRLWDDVAYVEVEGRVSGARAGQLLVSVSGVETGGRAIHFGERYGAVVGRQGAGSLEYQSDGMGRPSQDGLYPAWRWAAAAPGPELRFGLTRAMPLAPAAIVHGETAAARRAAQALQEALHAAGVPSTIHPSMPARTGPWSDATPLSDAMSALEAHAGMLVAVGLAQDDALLQRLLADTADTAKARYGQARQRGAVQATQVRLVESRSRFVPVVLVDAADEDALESLAEDVAEGIASLGFFTAPEEALLAESATPRRETGGVAMLFEGAHLAGLDADGGMVLCHGMTGSGDITFRYGICPLVGEEWRAEVERAAEGFAARPLAASVATAGGTIPVGESLMQAEALRVTAVKPAGFAGGGVAEGIAVRAWAPVREPWTGALGIGGAVHASTVMEVAGDAVVSPTVAGGEIATFILQPSRGAPLAKPAAAFGPTAPQPSRYIAHPQAIAPPGGAPLGMRVEVDWSAMTAQLHLANLQGHGMLQGEVKLTTSDGWSIGPERITFQIAPGDSTTTALTFAASRPARGMGAVLAVATAGGHTWFDCAREGAAWLDMQATRERGRLVVEVVNRMGVTAWGGVDAASGADTWPGFGESRVGTLSPRSLPLHLEPNARERYMFALGEGEATNIKLRVSANGHAQWVDVPR